MRALDKLWHEVNALAIQATPAILEDEYERGCRETAELILTMIEGYGGGIPCWIDEARKAFARQWHEDHGK